MAFPSAVLVHPSCASSRSLRPLFALFFVLAALLPTPASAQYLVNGQVFTAALAIVDAPAPKGVFHAGSNMPIAIDISGDGKLPSSSASSGSSVATGFDSLELYLVSSQNNLNMTVSSGPGLLTQEPGSTVKHLDFSVPSCVAAGDYNFTVYEGSHINGQSFFSITPIPISVENTNPSGSCQNGTNDLQAQPQPSSPPPQNPFLNTTGLPPLDTSSTSGGSASQLVTVASPSSSLTPLLTSTSPSSSSTPFLTPTSPSSSFPPVTSSSTANIVTLTIGPSGVVFPTPSSPSNPTTSPGDTVTFTTTDTESASTETDTVTFVLVSLATQTITAPGQTTGFTTVITSTTTQTNPSALTSSPVATGSNDNLIPVNAGSATYPSSSLILFFLFLGSFGLTSSWYHV